jgi:hypothetical protein
MSCVKIFWILSIIEILKLQIFGIWILLSSYNKTGITYRKPVASWLRIEANCAKEAQQRSFMLLFTLS